MPHQQLVQYCHANYNRPERCDDCPNDPCHNSCVACLDNIHQVHTHNRSYNCPNIINCYTCKYMYRYSTEIEYLLNRYITVFKNADNVKLWSIGCGPCTELFGLYRFKTSNNLTFNIDYKGFDLNPIWTPIHQFINQMNYFHSEFHTQDIFNYIETNEERPHIITLNYVLSDILRTNRDYIDLFIDNLCNWYSPMTNAFLILNDINLGRNNNESRYYYEIIVQRIRALRGINPLRHEGKYHFANSQRYYFSYGALNRYNQVQIQPTEDVAAFYSPWMECRSAQLVLF